VTPDRVKADLSGVPETLLWTLYHRSLEARRPDAVLHDPLAIELVDRIDYPFAEAFGTGFGQWQGLRSRTFDREIERFLAAHPDGTVVALGEGLETQFWRVDNGRVRWVTVDLPETVALRDQVLPLGPRQRMLATSVLDESWMGEVDASRGLLLTAQGLLMYLEIADVEWLVGVLARRFAGSALVFDAVPRWLAERSRQGKVGGDIGYAPPPWRWGLDAARERQLRRIPGVARLQRLRPPRGRGPLHGFTVPVLSRTPSLRYLLLAVLRADLTA
jgi:O-methyltransferase involved in polyketide biosynthesis